MEKFDYIERLLLLAKMNFEYINIDAIFSDESENYRTPVSPDANTETAVRIRTGINDLDKVYMCAGGEKYPMDIIKSQGYFDYYQCLYISPHFFYFFYNIPDFLYNIFPFYFPSYYLFYSIYIITYFYTIINRILHLFW